MSTSFQTDAHSLLLSWLKKKEKNVCKEAAPRAVGNLIFQRKNIKLNIGGDLLKILKIICF